MIPQPPLQPNQQLPTPPKYPQKPIETIQKLPQPPGPPGQNGQQPAPPQQFGMPPQLGQKIVPPVPPMPGMQNQQVLQKPPTMNIIAPPKPPQLQGQFNQGQPMMNMQTPPNFLNPATQGQAPIPNLMRPNMVMPGQNQPLPVAGQQQLVSPILNSLNPVQKKQVKSTGEQWKKLWIGNLSEELPDDDMQTLLKNCGEVVSWKRNKDAKGIWAKFGFVEFNQVEAVLKCQRLISNLEVAEDHFIKVKPSEQTQQFLDQWVDLKTNEWQLKTEEQRMGYKTFEEWLCKDDEQFKKDTKEAIDNIQLKLSAIQKEKAKEDEKKEHPREKERDSKKRHQKKDLEIRYEKKLEDWKKHEDEKRRRKRKEKDKEREKKEYIKQILEKELNMDSDEERQFITYKYKLTSRKKYRQREAEEDEDNRLKELAKIAPPEPVLPNHIIPQHTVEMEEQQPYKKTFQMQEITFNNLPQQTQQQPPQSMMGMNPERQQMIGMNPERQQMINDNKNNYNGNQQKSIFNDDDEEEEDKLKKKVPINISLPNQESNMQMQQRIAQEAREEEIQKKKEQEEIKKQLQGLIKDIPKDKYDLYNYQIDWIFFAKSDILDKKVRPWLINKSKEYLNEVEVNFVKMVIQRINNQETAENLEKKVRIILEEDAEEFVIKLWRMIIFELLKLKNGIIL